MIEIAGFLFSGLGALKNISDLYQDQNLKSWEVKDLEVDGEWVPLALNKDLLEGCEADYLWANLRRVPTLEMKGSHQVILAHNRDRKILNRIVRGPQNDRLVLTKKIPDS